MSLYHQTCTRKLTVSKNKRRRDRDDEPAEAPQEPAVDPLANATTLYVGNL